MSVRVLTAVLSICLAAVFVSGAAILLAIERKSDEDRKALALFVCAAVEVAEEQRTPEALRRAERFQEILIRIDESCPEP